MGIKFLKTLLVILTLNFFLPRFLPGDPFTSLSVEDGFENIVLSEDQIHAYQTYYGFDKPLPVQFIHYLKQLLQLDLGMSIYFKRPVAKMVFERLGWTLALVMMSTFISGLIGTVTGAFSAYVRKKNKKTDDNLLKTMTILSEIPDFLIGILFLFVFAGKLGWFPLGGGVSAFASYQTLGQWLMDYLHHAFLPCLVLSLGSIGDVYLLSRQNVISVLGETYILTAKAKGLKKWHIVLVHALSNAWQPILAKIMMRLGMLLGGAVLVENIFAYPGVGRLLREAVGFRDYTLIQGVFLIVAIAVLFFNTIADLIYKKADRRIDL